MLKRLSIILTVLCNLACVPYAYSGSVQALIDSAPSGSVIQLQHGTFIDNLIIDKDIILQGAGSGATTLDGGQRSNVIIVRTNRTVVVSGMTIQGDGLTNLTEDFYQPFGSVYSEGTLRLEDCVIDGSHHGGLGGQGVLSRGDLTLVRCSLINNRSTIPLSWASTGGVHCHSVVMSHCVLSNNWNDYGGSAIYCTGPGLVMDSIIVANHAPYTGEGAVLIKSGTNRVRFERTQIINNDSVEPAPPGVVNYGILELSQCLVAGHTATDHAAFLNYGDAVLENSTLSRNVAQDFMAAETAGIENYGSLRVRASTIVSNEVINSTSMADRAGGGGIRNRGVLRLESSVIALNRVRTIDFATGFRGQDILGPVISEGHNLILNTNDCIITGDVTGNIYGKDPLLGPLQDNGGPTPTHALLPGSPAIDAGAPALLGTLDQRGLPRAQDGDGDGKGLPDIGAFEVLGRSIPVILPLVSEDPALFVALLVGEPTTTYRLDQSADITHPIWREVSRLTTDAGGFGRFTISRNSREWENFFRAVKP